MRYFLTFTLFLIASCATPEAPTSEDKTLEDARQEALDNIDREACEKNGGEVRRAGLLGMPRCITPYGDADKECNAKSQCEGRCMAHDSVTDYDAPPGEAIDRCERNNNPFGCYATIDDGKLSPFICVD